MEDNSIHRSFRPSLFAPSKVLKKKDLPEAKDKKIQVYKQRASIWPPVNIFTGEVYTLEELNNN